MNCSILTSIQYKFILNQQAFNLCKKRQHANWEYVLKYLHEL